MQWTITQASPNGNIPNSPNGWIYPTDPGSQWQQHQWHYYMDGTFGSAANIQIQLSPDGSNVPDASKRIHSPTTLKQTAQSDGFFLSKFRAVRAVLASGGDGTTNVVVEIV